jgi:hypothetical protein
MDASGQATTPSAASAPNAANIANSSGTPTVPIAGRSTPPSSTGAGSQTPSQTGQRPQAPTGAQQNAQPRGQQQQTSGQQVNHQDQQNIQQQLDMLDLKEEDRKKYLELNVGGKAEKKTVEEWLQLANKGYAATKVWQESAQSRQLAAEYQQLRQLAQTQPDLALQHLFQNPEILNKFADNLVAKRLERQMMSPVERENVELKEQHERQLHQQQEWMRQQQQQAQQQLNAAAKQRVDEEMKSELKRVGFPDVDLLRRLAAYKIVETWDERVNMGLQPLSTAEAADMLPEMTFALLGNFYSNLSDEYLEKMIPDEISERRNNLRVARITGHKNQPPASARRPGSDGPTSEQRKPLSEDEYREYHRKLRYGE